MDGRGEAAIHPPFQTVRNQLQEVRLTLRGENLRSNQIVLLLEIGQKEAANRAESFSEC